MLRYLYTDDIQLNINNTPSILMVAHYYALQKLENVCSEWLIQRVSEHNVCTIYDRTHLVDNELTKQCLFYIQMNARNLLNHESSKKHMNLFNLGLDALGKIMALDLSIASEVVLFEKLLLWARTECEAQKLVPNGENLRRTTRGRLQLIRFSAMTSDDFGRCVRLAGPAFFTVEEIGTIFIHLNCDHEEFVSGTSNVPKKYLCKSDDFPVYHKPRAMYQQYRICAHCKNISIRNATSFPTDKQFCKSCLFYS